MFDLLNPEHSYIYGLFLADGSLCEESRNRGRLSISLKRSDENILYKIHDILDINSYISHRKRKTNFGIIDETTLKIYDLNFREKFKSYGFPVGKKSNICTIPNDKFQINDFYRGFIDGDGSLSFTKNNIPFIALTTKSKNFYLNYKKYCENITNNIINVNPNKRDNVYNVFITQENCQNIIKSLYYNNCLSIERKYISSQKILSWERPDNIIKRSIVKKWNNDEDLYIATHSIEESIIKLNRTEKSIKTRLWRLKNKGIVK